MKIKNIIKILVTTLLIATICAPENMVHGENSNANNEEFAYRKIIDAFNEEDVQNEFLNYTENTYSYSVGNELLRMVADESEVCTGTVIGAVYDNSTGNYLPNMWVYFEELDYYVVTGEEGRFKITGIPDGYYSVIVGGDGYLEATYGNNARTASYTVPTLPSFSVNYNGTITTYGATNVYYLYHVVANELLKPDATLYAGLAEAEKLEGFKAQAIAARTYATTRAAWGLAHLSDGYNFCSTTCCQVYNPAYTNTLTVRAVNDTNNMIVYDVTNNRLCDAFFFASCKGATTSYKNKWSNGNGWSRHDI